MSPNISIWCTTKEQIMTVPVLEGKLAERTYRVPGMTGLLTLGCGPSLRGSHCGERGLGVLLWLWEGLCCLGPQSPGLFLHLAFSVPSVSGAVLGARDVEMSETGSREQGAPSCVDDHSTMQETPQRSVHK